MLTWNGEAVRPRVRWSQHYPDGTPGPVTVRGTVRAQPGDHILVTLDTNLCLDTLRAGPVERHIGNCDDGRIPQWYERHVVDLGEALPAGEHVLEIDGHNPVPVLELRVADVTIPATGLPTPFDAGR